MRIRSRCDAPGHRRGKKSTTCSPPRSVRPRGDRSRGVSNGSNICPTETGVPHASAPAVPPNSWERSPCRNGALVWQRLARIHRRRGGLAASLDPPAPRRAIGFPGGVGGLLGEDRRGLLAFVTRRRRQSSRCSSGRRGRSKQARGLARSLPSRSWTIKAFDSCRSSAGSWTPGLASIGCQVRFSSGIQRWERRNRGCPFG